MNFKAINPEFTCTTYEKDAGVCWLDSHPKFLIERRQNSFCVSSQKGKSHLDDWNQVNNKSLPLECSIWESDVRWPPNLIVAILLGELKDTVPQVVLDYSCNGAKQLSDGDVQFVRKIGCAQVKAQTKLWDWCQSRDTQHSDDEIECSCMTLWLCRSQLLSLDGWV